MTDLFSLESANICTYSITITAVCRIYAVTDVNLHIQLLVPNPYWLYCTVCDGKSTQLYFPQLYFRSNQLLRYRFMSLFPLYPSAVNILDIAV